jgi:hypothetical protein
MELFRDIRLNRGRAILRKKLGKVQRSRFKGNLGNAKTIGVVWDASNPEELPTLSQFHQKMAEKNIDVKILGYYPGKNLPDRLTAIRYLICLKKEDINITYRPFTREAEAFVNTGFDILIDINFKNIFPLQYISSLSRAGLKVGIFDKEHDHSPFDLMIELNKTSDINTYLTQVIYYLEIINTKSSQKGELNKQL